VFFPCACYNTEKNRTIRGIFPLTTIQRSAIHPTPYIDVHHHHARERAGTIGICSLSADQPISRQHLPLYCSVGIHPWDAAESTLSEALARMEGVCSDPHCIAIGEVGLDRLRGPALAEQERVLRAQLDLAQVQDLPVILHDVRSTSDLLRIRKDYPRQQWILHGFRGTPELAEQCLGKGFHISLGPGLLKSAQRGASLGAVIPPDRLFLESDDSDRDIREMYDAVASWTGMQVSALLAQIEDNFHKVFGVQS